MVTSLLARGPARFVVLVPSVVPSGTMTWDEQEVWAAAERRAAEGVATFQGLGAEVVGRAGAHVPYNAVMDAVRSETFDEIVISTLPPAISGWLSGDLPGAVRRDAKLPVTHVVFDPAAATAPPTHASWDRPS